MAISLDKAQSPTYKIAELSDIDKWELIKADLDGSKPFTTAEIDALASEIRLRRKEAALVHESAEAILSISESSESISEGSEGAAASFEAIDGALNLGETSESLENFFSKMGHVGSLIASGIGLLTTPWQCIKESRWPTRDEAIKLGLCAAGVALAVVAITVPVIAAMVAVAIAGVSVLRSIQNIRIKQEELRRVEQLAFAGKNEIEQLFGEIKELKSQEHPTPEQIKTLGDYQNKLTGAIDQYIFDKREIYRLKDELSHPIKSLPNAIYVASSAIALIGVVLTLFFPPAGVALLLVAGVASLLTSVVTAGIKWYSKKQSLVEPVFSSPISDMASPLESDDESVSQEIKPAPELDSQLSSSAKEILALDAVSSVTAHINNVQAQPATPHETRSSTIAFEDEEDKLFAFTPSPSTTVSPEQKIECDIQEIKTSIDVLKKEGSNHEINDVAVEDQNKEDEGGEDEKGIKTVH